MLSLASKCRCEAGSSVGPKDWHKMKDWKPWVGSLLATGLGATSSAWLWSLLHFPKGCSLLPLQPPWPLCISPALAYIPSHPPFLPSLGNNLTIHTSPRSNVL